MKEIALFLACLMVMQFLFCRKEDIKPAPLAVCSFSLKNAPVFQDKISQEGSPWVSLDVEIDPATNSQTFIFSSSHKLAALTACAVTTAHPDQCRFFDLKNQYTRDGKIYLPVSEDVAECFALQSQKLFSLTFRIFC